MLSHSHKRDTFGAMVFAEGGRRILRFNAPKYLHHALNTRYEIGDKVTVNIVNQKPKRTVNQNNYYWGVYLPLIAEETGEDRIDYLHELFRGMFLTQTVAEVMGKKVRITKSTTDLTVSEFIEYIMKIEEFTGVTAPPTENWNLKPLRHAV